MLKRWLIRFALIIAAGIVLLAALFFARPLYLPDAFLIAQLERRISTATGLDLFIQSGHIQLRKAIILRGITLGDSSGGFSVTADELRLRYRLAPLLQKRAIFSEIQLSNPQVHIVSQAHGTAPTPDKAGLVNHAPQEPPTRPPSGLPFEIQAASLKVINASFLWKALGEGDTLRLLIPGINLLAQNAQLNRQVGLQAEWRLEQDGTASLEAIGLSASYVLTALSRLQFAVTTLEDSSHIVARLNLDPKIQFSSSRDSVQELAGPRTTLNFGARLTHWRDLAIDSLALSLDNLLSVQAGGFIADVFKAPRLDVRLPLATLYLESAWEFAQRMAGLFDADANWSDWEMAGLLQLQKGWLQWAPASLPPDLSASLPVDISDASLECHSLGLTVGDLFANSDFHFRLSSSDSVRLQGKVNLMAGTAAKSLNPDSSLELRSLDLSLTAEMAPGGRVPHIQLDWQARGPFNTRLAGNFAARADTLDRADPLSSPGFSLEGGGSMDGLPLEELFLNGPRGDVSLALDFKAQSLDDVNLKLGIFGWDVWFAWGDKAVWFPPSLLKLDAQCALGPGWESLYLKQARADWNPYFTCAFSDASTDFSSWEIGKSDVWLNLAEILPVVQPVLPAKFADAQISGLLQLNGSMKGAFQGGEFSLLPQSTLTASALDFAAPDFGLAADSISFVTALEGTWRDLAILGKLQAARLALPRIREFPYRRISLDFGGKLREFERLDSLDCQLQSDELGLQVTSRGWLDWRLPAIQGELSSQIHFAAADTVSPTADLACSGNLDANFDLALKADSSLSLAGRVSAESLFVDHRGGWRAQNLRLDLPFHQDAKFTPDGVAVPSAGSGAQSLPDPVQLAASESQYQAARNRGVFSAGLLQINPYVLTDLKVSVFLGQGFLHIPRMQARAYEGNLSGAGSIHFAALRPDSIRYEFQCDAQKMNSALLPGVGSSRHGQEAEITAFARFSGQVFQLEKDRALAGELEITKIGNQVADNILKFMDPEGNDPGIRTYRHYIQRGWGVKSFRFEVRDDFVYTSIAPAKPPFSKLDMFVLSRLIGLGPWLTFGRMPVSFFLLPKNTKPP